MDDQQKLEFLGKAVEADPFHVQAYHELRAMAATHPPMMPLHDATHPERQPDLAQQIVDEEKNMIEFENVIQVYERSFKQASSVALIGLGMVGAGILLEGLAISFLSQDNAACFFVPLIILALLGFLMAILGGYGRAKAHVRLAQAQKNLAEIKMKNVALKASRVGE